MNHKQLSNVISWAQSDLPTPALCPYCLHFQNCAEMQCFKCWIRVYSFVMVIFFCENECWAYLRMALTRLMWFLCKPAGTAVFQPAQEGSMSLGKAVCLHSLNPLKTSSCIYRPILQFSVYCSRTFIWEMWDFSPFWKALETDKQTNRQR